MLALFNRHLSLPEEAKATAEAVGQMQLPTFREEFSLNSRKASGLRSQDLGLDEGPVNWERDGNRRLVAIPKDGIVTQPPTEADKQTHALYEKVFYSAPLIKQYECGPSQCAPRALGSGFILNRDQTQKVFGTLASGLPDHILITNVHVVSGDRDQIADKVTADFPDKANKDAYSIGYVGDVLGIDPLNDVAVVKLDNAWKGPSLSLKVLEQTKTGGVGFAVFTLGNPHGMNGAFSKGQIRGRFNDVAHPNGHKSPNLIQTDAAINPGNSGGALMISTGEVVGINTFGANESGMGFSISAEHIVALLQTLKPSQKTGQPFADMHFVDTPQGVMLHRALRTDFAGLYPLVTYKKGLPVMSRELQPTFLAAVNDKPVRNLEDVVGILNQSAFTPLKAKVTLLEPRCRVSNSEPATFVGVQNVRHTQLPIASYWQKTIR